MLDPIGNGQDAVLLQEFADRLFLRRRILDPTLGVLGQLERRHIAIAFLFVTLECDRAIPFLASHREKFLRRVGEQRDILEEENISIATQRRFLWQRWQSFLKSRSKMLERIRRAISSAV